MSRRRRQDDEAISLFPFLSILACLIGVLTLMIGALALSQMDVQEDPEAQARSEQAAAVQRQIAAVQLEIDRLESRRESVEELREQLEIARQELQTLKVRQEELRQQASSNDALASVLKADIESLERRVAELEPQHVQQTEAISQLQAAVNDRFKPPPDPTMQFRSVGSGRYLQVAFIECRADGIVLYHSNEPIFVPSAEVAQNLDYLNLLERVAKHPRGVAVFLLRHDGLATYYLARDVAQLKSCRNGKLPLIGDGPIDISEVKGDFADPVERDSTSDKTRRDQ